MYKNYQTFRVSYLICFRNLCRDKDKYLPLHISTYVVLTFYNDNHTNDYDQLSCKYRASNNTDMFFTHSHFTFVFIKRLKK